MQTNDRREYEAFFTLDMLRKTAGDRTLEVIIREAMSFGQRDDSE